MTTMPHPPAAPPPNPPLVRARQRGARLAGLAASAAILLAACAAPPAPEPPQPEPPPPEVEAPPEPEVEPQPEASVAGYLAAAGRLPAPESYGYLLDAAGLLSAQTGGGDSLDAVLAVLRAAPLDRDNGARLRLLEARLHIGAGRYKTAAAILGSLVRNGRGLPPPLLAAVHETRARLALQRGRPLQAVFSLARRGALLEDGDEGLENDARLWRILLEMNPRTLEEALSGPTQAPETGWLNLALLYMENAGDRFALRRTLRQWRDTHPGHPSARLVETALLNDAPRTPARIALLLPLDSRFGGAARAFRDGFVDAHSADSDPGKPVIAIYDYGDAPHTIGAWYQRAVAEQAEVIVGPLGRDAVGTLLQDTLLRPTILLGGVPEAPPPGLEFTINPEYEAAGAARRAFRDGHRNAALLHYDSERGRRLAQAFTTAWEALGGSVIVARSYPRGGGNYAGIIRSMFNLDRGKRRRDALAVALGFRKFQELKYTPRRRRDLHFLFLVAGAGEGRSIKPLINFHQGHDLPVYSTSEIFSGKPQPALDADLNGVLFNDMRWMVAGDGLVNTLRRRLPSASGDYRHTALDRLYALGVDSYGLAFRRTADNRDAGSAGNTGDNAAAKARAAAWPGVSADITITPGGHARRALSWYIFQQGVPVAAGAAAGP